MPRTILLVDDSAVERTLVPGLLHNIYDVTAVESGAQMLAVLRSRATTISAIVLDLMMPEMDGFEILRLLRNNAIYRQIPVIVATALDGVELQVRVMALGANGFITKPFNKDLLVYTLENAINLREKSALVNNFRMDSLTGMYNRVRFLEIAETMIRRNPSGYYILSCVDIENFKVINEQYGTKTGDAVLRHVGGIIRDAAIALGGTSCRNSGDKFLMLYPADEKDSDTIRKLHRDAVENIKETHRIKIRVGRYLVDDITVPISAMCDRATLAEESIKGRYDILIANYTDDMRKKLVSEQQIVTVMEKALESGEFEPWLQPQYNHNTGALIGAEALVRWKRDGVYVPPSAFVPVFERNGFIYEMDLYIWEQVCRLLRRWMDEGREPLPISINISRRDLFHAHFVEKLTDLIRKYQLPYNKLRLEVTESAFAESSGIIIARVNELIGLGFTVEIDDFGSGYSSLNTLKEVPAAVLKMDMRFFENKGDSKRGGNIVESVVRMAKWLDMAVIAEGVEDKEQADYLKSIGCYYIQGYYYAKPMPVSEYEKLQEHGRREPQLTRLRSLRTLDNNEFWNPRSMDTLLFNSYVGAACIIEYSRGKIEMLRASDSYLKTLGTTMTLPELLKFDWTAHMDERTLGVFSDAVMESMATKEAVTSEYFFTGLPGCPAIIYLRVSLRAISTAGERILVYCLNDNITEQREAEARQKEAEKNQLRTMQQLSVIMKNINGGVSAIRIDEDGSSQFIFNNEKYYELYGYTRETAEAEHLDVMKLILPDSLPSVMDKIRKLKTDRQPTLIDYAIAKPDGTRALLRANASMMDMDGYHDVIASVITDITEKKLLEGQLQAIVDNIYGGVTATYLRDGQPQFAVINNQFFSMLGYATREEYEAACPNKYTGIYPEDKSRVIHQFETSDGGKKQYTMEYRIIRKDGAIRYVRNNISVVHLFGIKEPVQLSVCNDVTEQVEAEEKQIELLDNLPCGAALYEYDGETLSVVHINRRYWELVRRDCVDYSESSVADAVFPDDRRLIALEIGEAIRQNRNVSVDLRILCGESDYEPFHISATVTVANNGNYLLYASYSKITEQAMSVQDMLPVALSTMMSASGELAYVKDKELRYICCSQAVADLLGLASARDIIGKTDADLFEANYAAEFYEHSRQVLTSGNPMTDYLETVPTKDGAVRAVSSSIFPLMDASGGIVGIYGISRDVTAIREKESQLELLTSTIPGGLAAYSISADGYKNLYFNDGYYRYSGYTRAEYLALVEQEPLALVFEEDRDNLREMLRTFSAERRDGMTGRCSYRCRTKSGATRFMSAKAALTTLGSEQYILNIVQLDMTEQVEAEKKREDLLDNLPFGAAMYTFDGASLKALHINKQYRAMVNREINSTLDGFSPIDFIHPDDRVIALNEVKDAIAHNRDGSCDIRLLYGCDEYRTFHLDSRIVPQGDGSYLLYVAHTARMASSFTPTI